MSREEAIATVANNVIKNGQTNKYECLLCLGKYQVVFKICISFTAKTLFYSLTGLDLGD